MNKKVASPLEKMIDKSINELSANAKAVEEALEKLVQQEGVKVSTQEYQEIKYLTDTMSQLDEILLNLDKKPVKKKTKKRKAKRRKK